MIKNELEICGDCKYWRPKGNSQSTDVPQSYGIEGRCVKPKINLKTAYEFRTPQQSIELSIKQDQRFDLQPIFKTIQQTGSSCFAKLKSEMAGVLMDGVSSPSLHRFSPKAGSHGLGIGASGLIAYRRSH